MRGVLRSHDMPLNEESFAGRAPKHEYRSHELHLSQRSIGSSQRSQHGSSHPSVRALVALWSPSTCCHYTKRARIFHLRLYLDSLPLGGRPRVCRWSGMEWSFVRDGQAVGPTDIETLNESFRVGSLGPTDLVWQPGMDGWVSATTVPSQRARSRLRMRWPELSGPTISL
jgi:GYF domain 2